MNNKVIYIDLQQVIDLHNWIAENTDELQKKQDYSHLEKILRQIKSDDYPELKDKLTQSASHLCAR